MTSAQSTHGALPQAPHDPYFRAATAPAFTHDLLAGLAAGRYAAVRVPGFLPRAWCEEVLGALKERAFDSYGTTRIHPPVMRFGVGVSDHMADGGVADSYWKALEGHHEAWQSLGLSFDPFRTCREGLATHWPQGVEVGRRGGREMGDGVAREPNQGFRVHFDDALREYEEDLLDTPLIGQFAFNLYLSVPPSGGETVLWRHRWQPGDEAYRLPNASYGYDESVVRGAESIELAPEVGEALLIDPRNFHAVRPSHGDRRIALGFAVGIGTSGQLLTWA
ncbi:proline hydroxylase [Streptomyces sp. NBC_00249]|uniref:proline hydroxylase n=1 Tax=Streptomyces sp. NBC_00249 TaxID=2975690 RepID=UPI00225A93A0|nr:proline hydroxylase [Streptomyces sp. NBC_00249]MCX5195468.1 proline hydroxylase [Streptomyces sp. NBC_00249]